LLQTVTETAPLVWLGHTIVDAASEEAALDVPDEKANSAAGVGNWGVQI